MGVRCPNQKEETLKLRFLFPYVLAGGPDDLCC